MGRRGPSLKAVLLDTQAFLWWLSGDERLPPGPREVIGDEETVVYVSAVSAWEICTKVRIGKLPGARIVAQDVSACLVSQAFSPLSVTVEHAQRAGNLPGPHRDPFDRMLIAQSQSLDIPLVSNEKLFDGYGVRRIW